jgi:MAF protein
MRIALASGSPRRRELLALLGLSFSVVLPHIDEAVLPGEAPAAYVRRLAMDKARAGADRVYANRARGVPIDWVLAADTSVVDGGDILGKPADEDEARAMLERLRGRTHRVLTGICLAEPLGDVIADVAVTDVPMRAYTDDEIAAYIATGDPFDKAGGYAIQHAHFHPVEGLTGCYANVVGLPLCHLARNWPAPLETDVPAACQSALGYDCPVYAAILAGEDPT